MPADLVAKLFGNRAAVSPIVTVEPRRRQFRKPVTLTFPLPRAASKGMTNQYSQGSRTLRLLSSMSGTEILMFTKAVIMIKLPKGERSYNDVVFCKMLMMGLALMLCA